MTSLIPGPTGQLEIAVDPAENPRADLIAVVCHPNPIEGGTMTNKVVTMVSRAYNQLGITALRFNFRGVGQSEGEFDYARGEVDDALAVIDWASEQYPDAKLCLAGFSFGAYVALLAVQQRPVVQLTTIAPAVNYFNDSEHRLDADRIEQPPCPWLLIQGGKDEVVVADEVLTWAKKYPTPPEVVLLPESSHFFHRQLVVLRDELINRLKKQLAL